VVLLLPAKVGVKHWPARISLAFSPRNANASPRQLLYDSPARHEHALGLPQPGEAVLCAEKAGETGVDDLHRGIGQGNMAGGGGQHADVFRGIREQTRIELGSEPVTPSRLEKQHPIAQAVEAVTQPDSLLVRAQDLGPAGEGRNQHHQ